MAGDQQQPTSEIVGREGLGSTIAQIAGQVSSLEKSTVSSISALRELFQARLDAVEEAGQEWRKHHENVHILEQEALSKAFDAMEVWKAGANEWRGESRDRMLTYPTKSEIEQMLARVESMVLRNREDLDKFMRETAANFKPVNDYITASTSSMNTLRALMVIVIFMVTVAGFFIGVR